MKIKDISLVDPKKSININKLDFINYLETSDVKDGEIINSTFLKKNYPSSAKKEIRENDILLSKVRPYLKHNCIIKQPKNNFVASSAFIQIRVIEKIWNPKFIYYFLTCNKNINLYICNCSGTTYPTFDKKIVANLILPEVSHQKQQHIVNITIHLFLFLRFL